MRLISILFVGFFLLSPPSHFFGQDQKDYRVTALPSHISFTVDEDTFAELQASDFLLKKFAGTSVKSLTVDSGVSWTGVYVFGRNTSLEFYREEEDFPVGSCSIAFEVSKAGELKKIKYRLEERWGTLLGEIELRTKVIDKHESPWFHYLDLYDFVGSDSLCPWLLEWDPNAISEHFKKPMTALVDDQGERYDDPSFIGERIFENVIEIKTPLKKSELDEWSRFLIALGFKRADRGDAVRFSRSDLTFNFTIDSKTSFLELKMSLLREYQSREEYSFGGLLRLKFNGDKTASLFFSQIGLKKIQTDPGIGLNLD